MDRKQGNNVRMTKRQYVLEIADLRMAALDPEVDADFNRAEYEKALMRRKFADLRQALAYHKENGFLLGRRNRG